MQIVFLLVFILGGGYICLLRTRNLWLRRKNAILQKKLRKSRRKEQNWSTGWDLEKQRFLEALTDSFLLVNRHGQVLAANRQAIVLMGNEELEGKILLNNIKSERLCEEIRKSLECEHAYKAEFCLGPPDGEDPELNELRVWLYIDVARILDVEGHRRILIRDITEQYRAEQVRKDFVANASHELRTPLTIIIGYLESMLEDLEESGFLTGTAEFLPTMHRHSLRLQRIVEDMLMISKLESGEVNLLKEESFFVFDCIHEVRAHLENLFEERSAICILSINPERIFLRGDRFYWTQIFFNLIENALKQNNNPGLIVEIGAHLMEDGSIELWVSDNGVGIEKHQIPYIFNRFYRGTSHSTNGIKGTGLGLSIVKRAVEGHGGSISVTSIPGRETRFTITLPPDRLAVDPGTSGEGQ